jgi:hypothetical protein
MAFSWESALKTYELRDLAEVLYRADPKVGFAGAALRAWSAQRRKLTEKEMTLLLAECVAVVQSDEEYECDKSISTTTEG